MEFTFVEARGRAIVIPIPEHEIVWTTEPFGEVERSLAGVLARVIPFELLRAGKQEARKHRLRRAKDVADFAALAGI